MFRSAENDNQPFSSLLINSKSFFSLVSTAAGLVVAIFTLLVANLFRGLYKHQVDLIQASGGQLALLYKRHYKTLKQGEKAYAST